MSLEGTSRWAATVALLAALSAVMVVLKLRVPFPLLPFLTFHLSEIPVVLAFLLLGFRAGATVSVASWLALNLGAPFQAIVGPLMKLLAELSMLTGLYLAERMGAKRESMGRGGLAGMTFMGALVRTGVMAAATFTLYYLIFPEIYLPFAGKILSKLFGFEMGPGLTAALIIVALTSVFNLLHAPLSILPAAAIHKAYRRMSGRAR